MGKSQTKAEPRNELKTLAPDAVQWKIGNKVFEQKPLRIDHLSDVMEEVVDIVLGGGRGAIFDQIVDMAGKGDAKDVAGSAAMPIIVRTLVAVPRRLPKIVSMILPDAKEQYLRDNMNARQALQVVKTFIEQNEIGALIQDFFGLVQSATLSVQQATEEIETEEEPDSDSETEKKIEEE